MADPRPTVGFIGLGLMGSRMAGRLLDCGFPLVVWNRTASKADALVARGALRMPSPERLAADSAAIVTMIADPAALFEVADACAPALRTGQVFIDMSTVGPQASREAAALVRSRGAAFVDAPVLGSLAPAASGDLIVFAGGGDADIAAARPVLAALGKRLFRCGPTGSGSALKVVANLMICRMVEALGEALALGTRQGLPGETVLEMLDAGALASPMWKRGATLLECEPPLHFPLRHAVKDLTLAEQAARECGASLPAAPAVRAVFEAALARGLGEADYSVVVREMLHLSRAAPLP